MKCLHCCCTLCPRRDFNLTLTLYPRFGVADITESAGRRIRGSSGSQVMVRVREG